MSVNITVNGKFGRRCEQFSLLDDVERKKKELEAENRKQRIRKVREQAKVVARKVREDVAEEKKRQMRIIQEKEAREFCALREQAIAQAQQNFRSAVFQIGEAHRAAKLENEQRSARDKEKAATYKQFKKQYKPRTTCRNIENQQNLPNIPKPSVNKTACTQTDLAEVASTKKCPAERKDSEHPCRCCPCILESEDESSSDLQGCCDISSSSSEEDKDVTIVPSSKCTQTNIKGTMLRKTPAVVLEVDVEDNDIVTVTTPREVKDSFRESNRQFSTVVRVSPKKTTKPAVLQCEEAPTSSDSKTTTESSATSVSNNRRRFTQISDLIQKKSQTSTVTSSMTEQKKSQNTTTTPLTSMKPQSPRKRSESTIRQPSTSPSRKHVQLSPKTRPKKLPRKESISTKNTDSSSIQRSTVTLCSGTTLESGSGNSGRVQFFDYKNKYTREYPQPVKAVQVQPKSQMQPTAMEQASIEKQLQSAREDEIEKMRQRSEERGQKALEREQVRRDCNELTEKLEALTKQNTHLIPSDTNILASHRYADAAARKEVKMNNAIEEILMRPAIITCKEVAQSTQPKAVRPSAPITVPSSLNLGAPVLADHNNSNNSSDSCHSILLGYVNDQSQQIKNDLNQYEANPQRNQEKSKKLKNLLDRITQLRDCLLTELESGSPKSDVNNVQQVIDSISNLRQERERILIDCIGESKSTPLEDREKLLKQKEAILEKKVREFYKLQKNCKPPLEKSSRGKSQESIHKVMTDGEKPLEIIIKVKGDSGSTKSKKIKVRSKSKSPRKLATLIQSPVIKKNKTLGTTKEKVELIKRQNSYDSNSTSYRSLPPKITNKVDEVVDHVTKAKKTDHDMEKNSKESLIQSRSGEVEKKSTRLNPLVAHYVQRLLGMSRNSINALGVSSSEIETPSSSIINTTANVSGSESENLSTERINRVQKFIDENHNLINELEESLRSQNNSNISLESSLKAFEEIWKQKLHEKNKQKQRIGEKASKKKQLEDAENVNVVSKEKTSNSKIRTMEPQGLPSRKEITTSGLESQQKLKAEVQKQTSNGKLKGNTRPGEDGSKQKLSSNSSFQKETSKKIEKCSETTKNNQSTSDTESQIVRYAQLTENCTHRIAELTELINKVREEKQKILENTLSSVSENGQNSTEYMDLPDALLRARASVEHSHSEPSTSKILDSNLINEMPDSSTEMSRTENPPLEKHKLTGMSRDSGISMSRPVTAQEQLQDLEPQSLASSTGHSSMRKPKPPPTLSRFSPQLIEDELAHELSTILEVDTPATSRINTSVMPGNGATSTTSHQEQRRNSQAKYKFPTFDEYIQQINLDLTQVDAEKSIQVQHEFKEFITALGEAKSNKALNYDEFPSLTAYLQNLTLTNDTNDYGHHTLSETSPETIDELLACLRVANLTIKSFPTKKEYMQKIATNTPDQNLIESASLENLTTDGHVGTDTESESINIEEELRRRNILRSSFRKATQRDEIFTSTGHNGMPGHTAYMRTLTAESGIEKLSTSDNQSGDLERDLLRVGIKWPTTMRNKAKETEALSSTTSTSNLNSFSIREKQQTHEPSPPSAHKPTGSKTHHSENSVNEDGRPLNLRDFLTKELLKHANTSSSGSSCDESLRSQFFQSIIGSITPGCTPRQNHGSGGITLDRQKTSTPVVSQSTRSSSQNGSSSSTSTSTQLFSGESRLSSVHFHHSTSMRCQNDSGKHRHNSSDHKNHQ